MFYLTDACFFADTDWCSVAVCDQQCNETSDGSSFTCSCRDGYILNDDMRTCRGELMHTCDDDDLCIVIMVNIPCQKMYR